MKTVYQFKLNGEFVASYKSLAAAAESVGVAKETISGVCNGKRKSCRGYLWSFNDKVEIENHDVEKEWKDIPGFEGRYQMSRDGEIKRLPYKITQCVNGVEYTREFGEKILGQNVDSEGYLYANLGDDRYRVHWLLYNTFVGDSRGYVVDHIDRNKLNNDLSNLRLLTQGLNNLNKTLVFKPPITNISKYYQEKHNETRGGLTKPYMLKFTDDKKSKHYYFSTYEEAENKYRELYNERQKRIDASSKVFAINF